MFLWQKILSILGFGGPGGGCHGTKMQIGGDASRKVGIVGSPNVGKSMLFNKLTGAYVTVSNYPGTTVNVSRGKARIQGEEFEIVDTPGMNAIFTEHETRTRAFLQDANACLWVFNAIGTGGGSFTEQALAEIKRYKRRVIAVLNRIDALPTEDDRAKVRKYVRDHFSPYFDNELIDYAARDVYDARMAGNEQAAAFQEYYLPLALYLRTQFFDAGEGLAKEKAATSLDAVIHLLGELGQEYKTYAPAIEEEVQAALDLTGLQDQARSELNHQADGIDANLAAFIDERCEILRKRVEDILLTFIDAEVRLRLDFKKMKDKAYIEGKINEEYGLEELIKSSIERTMNRLKNLLEREWEDAIPTVVEKLGGDRAKLGPIQSAMQEAMVNVLMDIAMKLGGLAALFAVLWIIPGGQIVDAVIMAVVATLQVFTQGRFIDSIIEKKKKKARTGVVRIAMSQCEAIRDKLTIEAENWNRECLDGVLEAVAEERDEAQQRKDELTKLKRMRVQHVKRVRSYANVYEDHKDDLNG